MKQLKSGSALEPTKIEGPGEWHDRFSMNGGGRMATPIMYNTPRMPDLWARMRGYVRRVEDCEHGRKKFADYAMKWVCMDCGTDL